jgi:predicted nucleic acid-binding protein
MFLDTCILYELLLIKNPKTLYLGKEQTLFLNELIFFELGNLLLSRTKDAIFVSKTLNFIHTSKMFQVLKHSELDLEIGLDIMYKYQEHKLSIVDCVSVIQAKRLNKSFITADYRIQFIAGSKVEIIQI